MKNNQKNYAYIDGANLHKGIRSLGWELDYRRFRKWLSDKYQVQIAYIFIGKLTQNERLYSYLQFVGYEIIFKEVTYDNSGKVKGNCDADLVLQLARDFYEDNFHQAVLVTSDGDFVSLVRMLVDEGCLSAVLSPGNAAMCSILLKRTDAKITYLSDVRHRLEKTSHNEKAPGTDETVQGSSS